MTNVTNITQHTDRDQIYEDGSEVDVIYVSIEVIVAILAVVGNLLVIVVFARSASVRTTTNYYVISLAVADLLVGLIGIPFAIATSIGKPENFHACLFTNSLLLLLCTGSIFSLVAVSIDRFWAIRWPLTYPKRMTHRAALCIISLSWVLAALVGLLPVMGWNKGRPKTPSCYFMEVMDMRYLATLYFGTILLPMMLMAVVYGIIFNAVKKQITKTCEHMVPASAKEQAQAQCTRAQVKAAKILAVIILLFCVSWIPLYTFNTVKCFCPQCTVPPAFLKFLIILTHCNSAWNPALYAWGMKDFKRALWVMCSKRGSCEPMKLVVVHEKTFSTKYDSTVNGTYHRGTEATIPSDNIRDKML